MMYLRTFCTMISCVLIYLINSCDGNILPHCRLCKGMKCADVDPVDCLHGITKDFCGRIVCAKGPGMRCGGHANIMGRCGEGMQCRCERCTGCSLHTLKCDFNKLLCLT
ncbi:hypothetical protein J6590_064611 [Homalodisca vitripennis]|nr:hypothetical protein J6590_064611 [Homalodisca vitripennis]